MIVRVGNHLRPAHFEKRPFNNLPEIYETASTSPQPTIDGLLRQQANTSAAKQRFRILHGGKDPSNMGLFGTEIDFGTTTTQPRTEPITNLYFMDDPEITELMTSTKLNQHVFGAEHQAEMKYLLELLAIEHEVDMKRAWRDVKDIHTLMSCGLKEEVARELMQQEPDDVHTLCKHIRLLGRWYHGNVDNTVPGPGKPWEMRSGLADTHKMLAELPSLFFDMETGSPKECSVDTVYDALDLYMARPEKKLSANQQWREYIPLSKYAISSTAQGEKRIRESVERIYTLYPRNRSPRGEIAGVKAGAAKR